MRSAINVGFPGPNYVTELGNRDAILPGIYEIEHGALSATSSASIGNLTLSATAAAVASATSARTIAAPTLAAAATGTVSASLAATMADLTLAATGTVTVSAALTTTLDPITVDATGSVIPVAVASRGSGVPWWWPAYVRRHEADREAARLKWRDEHTIEGDGYYVMPLPTAHGEFLHDPDEADMAALAAASLWLLAA
jgi:hypothetical protein